MQVKIIIADDHHITLHGLDSFINDFDKYKVIGKANTGSEVIALLQKETPDIILTDIDMPMMSGIELLHVVNANYKNIKVIACTMHTNVRTIKQLISNNIGGIVSKSSMMEDIENCIDSVLNNSRFYSSDISDLLNSNNKKIKSNFCFDIELTKRERQILHLISDECTTNEIAEKLILSNNTIETHRKNLFLKFEVKNVVGLIKKAMEFGLLD